MKKRNIITIIGLSLLLTPTLVNAASAKISVSSNKSSINVGNIVSITYRISSSSPLGAWDYQITTPSNFTLQSCNNGQAAHQNGYVNNSSTKSSSVTCTFKATNTGKGTFSVKNYEVDGFDEKTMGTTVGSTSVSVIKVTNNTTTNNTKEEKTYSSNNSLKSLTVDGYKLDPTFKKDTTKYTLELENNIKSIKVNATKEDDKASISGTGEIKLEEGINKIEIKVTAENGSSKTYIINATVKEKTPITVTINDEKYTVVRKKENLKSPSSTYKETTVSIENEEIPAFNSEITKYTLVGLKDKEGNINLYIYNEKDKSFTLYKEITFKSISLQIIDKNLDLGKDYKKTTLKINDDEFSAYNSTKNKDFYLLYGMNIETGKSDIYRYDSKEGTLQRYIKEKTNSFDNYYIYGIVALSTILVITYIVILINLIKKRPKLRINFDDKESKNIKEKDENKET